MPNTTAAERKDQRKNATGRNNTANKMQKTAEQNSNIQICPKKKATAQKKRKQKAENQKIIFTTPKHNRNQTTRPTNTQKRPNRQSKKHSRKQQQQKNNTQRSTAKQKQKETQRKRAQNK